MRSPGSVSGYREVGSSKQYSNRRLDSAHSRGGLPLRVQLHHLDTWDTFARKLPSTLQLSLPVTKKKWLDKMIYSTVFHPLALNAARKLKEGVGLTQRPCTKAPDAVWPLPR